MVVSDRPGPLVAERTAARDEVGELLDELVGKPQITNPGWFDVLSLVGGAALVSWATFGGGPGWAAFWGWLGVVFGLVMPVRVLWRRAGATRVNLRRRRMAAHGTLLDVESSVVGEIVAAYERLTDIVYPPAGPWSIPALEAGHGAMLDVAMLLDGRAPTTPAEIEYIAARTRAMVDLASAAERQREEEARRSRLSIEEEQTQARQAKAAMADAMQEIEVTTGTGSLREMKRVLRLMRGEEGDGPNAKPDQP